MNRPTAVASAASLVAADNSPGLQHINSIAAFEAVWELDVCGNCRGAFAAARADAAATAAAREGVLTLVIADAVRA